MIDISTDTYLARMAVVEAMAFIAAPHVRMRPSVFPDGDKWCCLYGEDLQVGLAGFGDTAEQACAAFDLAWSTERTPAATLAQAIEARRAETGTGSVHESAVGNADAPGDPS